MSAERRARGRGRPQGGLAAQHQAAQGAKRPQVLHVLLRAERTLKDESSAPPRGNRTRSRPTSCLVMVSAVVCSNGTPGSTVGPCTGTVTCPTAAGARAHTQHVRLASASASRSRLCRKDTVYCATASGCASNVARMGDRR